MKPVGKTYLIEVVKHNEIEKLDCGLYIPNDTSVHDIFYEGTIVEYGCGWTDDELKDLIPIGTKIIMDYSSKKGTKLQLTERILIIHESDQIIAIKEDSND